MKMCTDPMRHCCNCGAKADVETIESQYAHAAYLCAACLRAALALLAPADVRGLVENYGSACEEFGECQGLPKKQAMVAKEADAAERALLAAIAAPPPEAVAMAVAIVAYGEPQEVARWTNVDMALAAFLAKYPNPTAKQGE